MLINQPNSILIPTTRLIILFLLIAICHTTARTRNKLAKKDVNEKQVIITAIGQCPGEEGLPVNVVPMDIRRQGRFEYFIDGVVLIQEDFDDGFEATFEVLRCEQREIIETCTSVLNYINSSDICELLRRPVDAYTHALDLIQPRPLCPLKKTSFFLHHLPTDNSFLNGEFVTGCSGYLPQSHLNCRIHNNTCFKTLGWQCRREKLRAPRKEMQGNQNPSNSISLTISPKLKLNSTDKTFEFDLSPSQKSLFS